MRRRGSSACLVEGAEPVAAGVAVAEGTTGAARMGPVPLLGCAVGLAHHLATLCTGHVTGCHLPCMYLVHHELESVAITIM